MLGGIRVLCWSERSLCTDARARRYLTFITQGDGAAIRANKTPPYLQSFLIVTYSGSSHAFDYRVVKDSSCHQIIMVNSMPNTNEYVSLSSGIIEESCLLLNLQRSVSNIFLRYHLE